MSHSRMRLGCDIGGTFTDFVLLDLSVGKVHTHKTLTTPDDPARAVVTGLQELLSKVGSPADKLELVIHATTLITNALIERRGATTALIATDGFRDILHMGSELRYDVYDLFMRRPQPLVPRSRSYGLRERLASDGRVLVDVDTDQLREIAAALDRQGVESVAVCLLHSFRNPSHERRARDFLKHLLPRISISLSSEVAPEIREYERASTTAANAYVQPLAERYLTRLVTRLNGLGYQRPLYIMLSSGGITKAETASAFPIRMVESGPAAGVSAASFYGAAVGCQDVLAFDMGGTTAKACVILGGMPSKTSVFEVARVDRFKKGSGLPVRVPAIDLIEIGAGGGSIAWIDTMGLLKVGPMSAGADPGPVAYGFGSTEPTVTDANVVLGYLNPEYFLGGRMPLSIDAACEAIENRIARPLGMNVEEAAAGIFRVVNENMVAAAKAHAAERGVDPRRLTLLAFGGAGPVHAYEVARALKMRRVVIPLGAGAASAFGLLVAPVSFDLSRSYVTRLDRVTSHELERLFAEMASEGVALLGAAGIDPSEIQVTRRIDMRHRGQGHELTIDLNGWQVGDIDALRRLFYDRYRDIYGHAHEHLPVEILTCRLTVSGPTPHVDLPKPPAGNTGVDAARKGERLAYFPERNAFVPTPVYDRYRLPNDAVFRGPAIIEEHESTAVIGPGAEISVDVNNNLIVTLADESSQ